MNRVFRAELDLDLIAANLSKENRDGVSSAEVLTWLNESGFFRTSAGWLVREADLGQVNPAEVKRLDLFEGQDEQPGQQSADSLVLPPVNDASGSYLLHA